MSGYDHKGFEKDTEVKRQLLSAISLITTSLGRLFS